MAHPANPLNPEPWMPWFMFVPGQILRAPDGRTRVVKKGDAFGHATATTISWEDGGESDAGFVRATYTYVRGPYEHGPAGRR